MGSVKLAVTVQAALAKKYDAAAMKKLGDGVKAWIAADKKRGLDTVYVAVDDKTAMKSLGVSPVKGRVTAAKMKRAVDALWARLSPEYLVLMGADDVVPYFVVTNPSHDPNGDSDVTVRTDNPYASSKPFRAAGLQSYLVPDRVVGRIPDAPGESDPAWLLEYLEVATAWIPQPPSAYAGAYAICAEEWSGAGKECAQAIGAPVANLMLSPPDVDASAKSRSRLTARLHMVKCHGSLINPNYFGQRGDDFPVALASETLRPRVAKTTVAAAGCCYGAQLFSPQDPALKPAGAWPMASTYLRGGAHGLMGSTEIAWVGVDHMACADWIVTGYLKSVLRGASMGRAMLDSKQDYIAYLGQQGSTPGIEDEKTLLEFVLLGDPSIQPVATAPAGVPRRALAAMPASPMLVGTASERVQRRFYRAQMAEQIRSTLPVRSAAKSGVVKRAGKLFSVVQDLLRGDAKRFGFSRTKVTVQRLEVKLAGGGPVVAAFTRAPARRMPVSRQSETIHYYWSGRRVVNGQVQIRLARLETDSRGQVLRTRVVRSS